MCRSHFFAQHSDFPGSCHHRCLCIPDQENSNNTNNTAHKPAVRFEEIKNGPTCRHQSRNKKPALIIPDWWQSNWGSNLKQKETTKKYKNLTDKQTRRAQGTQEGTDANFFFYLWQGSKWVFRDVEIFLWKTLLFGHQLQEISMSARPRMHQWGEVFLCSQMQYTHKCDTK